MQRLALDWKRSGCRAALVPTMGYLHEGHLSLVERARSGVGAEGKVVVSIYVNPTQFGPSEDLAKYPRDLRRDLKLCRAAGVDLVFVPEDGEMYHAEPGAAASTFVTEEALTQGMEGQSRPTHFRGVATVVAKLFNLVLPEVAVFGEKDFQQAALIRRMTRDLFFPVRILVAPTRREADGLAMSSRNVYLSASERREAVVLTRSIEEVRQRVRRFPESAASLKRMVEKRVAAIAGSSLDYVEFFDPETLAPAKRVGPGVRMALAVFMGRTRLIDNGLL